MNDDEALLADLGAAMWTEVRVRIARDLAAAAVEVLRRLGPGDDVEVEEALGALGAAGGVALIGLAVEGGAWENGDEVVVDLDPRPLAAAMAPRR